MTDDLVVGGQLGNYLIESVIGRGGMSVVYRAKHSRLGTSVALKVLAPELSTDDSYRERFLREAQMAAGIDHANVIPIQDMGLHDNSLYIVMRYIQGGDLKTLLATSGPLEAERALSLLMPIARALDTAHAHGLVHRDVKPGNILIQRSPTGEIEHVYLTDFGIAKSSASMSGLTRAGGVIGTVEYMAPEQIQGRDVSAQTDVYALAGVFYECITGRTPFEREVAEGAWPPVGPVEPVSKIRPELPSTLDGVIAKGLARDPAERYVTCEQLLRACAYVLESRPSERLAAAGETVVDAGPSGSETVAAGPEAAAAAAAWASNRERESAPAAEPWPPPAQPPPPAQQPPPPPVQQPAAARGAGRDGAQAKVGRRRLYGAIAAGVIIVAIAAVVLSSSSSSKAGKPSSASLGQVPTNRVTGSGKATVALKGNVATVTLTTNGLDYDESLAHALHIHTGGKGECPPASAAHPHNGHLSISTTDGINYYGPPAASLTLHGDTSTASILAFSRYPTGGAIRYTRKFTLPASVAESIRKNNAVIVVHGTDYDHSGLYSGVLERSDLNKAVPATATAPALCGPLVGGQKTTASSGTSRAHGTYTATLLVNPAVDSVGGEGLFTCEVGGELAVPPPTRRTDPAATAVEAPLRA